MIRLQLLLIFTLVSKDPWTARPGYNHPIPLPLREFTPLPGCARNDLVKAFTKRCPETVDFVLHTHLSTWWETSMAGDSGIKQGTGEQAVLPDLAPQTGKPKSRLKSRDNTTAVKRRCVSTACIACRKRKSKVLADFH